MGEGGGTRGPREARKGVVDAALNVSLRRRRRRLGLLLVAAFVFGVITNTHPLVALDGQLRNVGAAFDSSPRDSNDKD